MTATMENASAATVEDGAAAVKGRTTAMECLSAAESWGMEGWSTSATASAEGWGRASVERWTTAVEGWTTAAASATMERWTTSASTTVEGWAAAARGRSRRNSAAAMSTAGTTPDELDLQSLSGRTHCRLCAGTHRRHRLCRSFRRRKHQQRRRREAEATRKTACRVFHPQHDRFSLVQATESTRRSRRLSVASLRSPQH
jgi:hypothetical protein